MIEANAQDRLSWKFREEELADGTYTNLSPLDLKQKYSNCNMDRIDKYDICEEVKNE